MLINWGMQLKSNNSNLKARVLHAPYNIAGGPYVMATSMRSLGHYSQSICYPVAGQIFKSDQYIDPNESIGRKMLRLVDVVSKFDVFVFWYGTSLLGPELAEIPLLKWLGKKVIFYFVGCDIRREKEVTRTSAISSCSVCFPKLCSRNRDRAREMAQLYADVIFVSTPDLLSSVTGAKLLEQPIILTPESEVKISRTREYSRSHPLRIAHGPSARLLKGTNFVLEAVDRLKSQGYFIELDLVEGVENREAIRRYANADIAIDQLLTGTYGTFAVECMSVGTPVLVYMNPRYLPGYPVPPPVINTHPAEIANRLKEILDGNVDLESLSQSGIEYAQSRHSANAVAIRFFDHLSKV